MDYWVEMAKAIAELGVLVVIAGIFLFISMKNNNRQDEFFTKLFNNIIDQMKICSGGHVLTEEEDQTAGQIDKTINSYLQSTIADLGASRAMVARYHNGGKDMNSISFLKVSVTNESVSHGNLPCMGDFQNQFRAMVGYPVSEIDRTGHCLISDIEQIKDKDIGTYELLKARGVRSAYCYKLTSLTGYVVGAVFVIYKTSNKIQENAVEVDQYLSHVADKISSLMNMAETE